MSKYLTFPDVQFKSKDVLIAALVSMGWTEAQIQVFPEPMPLYGYKGDKRADTADIIIRRRYVGEQSNDLGFAKNKDGAYVPIVSEYDESYLKRHKAQGQTEFVSALRASYNTEVARRVAAKLKGKMTMSQQGSVRRIVVSY